MPNINFLVLKTQILTPFTIPPLKDKVTVGLKRGKLYFIAIITVLRSKKDFYLVNVTLSQNHILLIKMWGRFCTF